MSDGASWWSAVWRASVVMISLQVSLKQNAIELVSKIDSAIEYVQWLNSACYNFGFGPTGFNKMNCSSSFPSSSSTETSLPGLSTGASAGIGVGIALVVLLIIAAVILIIWRRRRRQRKADQAEDQVSEQNYQPVPYRGADTRSHDQPRAAARYGYKERSNNFTRSGTETAIRISTPPISGDWSQFCPKPARSRDRSTHSYHSELEGSPPPARYSQAFGKGPSTSSRDTPKRFSEAEEVYELPAGGVSRSGSRK